MCFLPSITFNVYETVVAGGPEPYGATLRFSMLIRMFEFRHSHLTFTERSYSLTVRPQVSLGAKLEMAVSESTNLIPCRPFDLTEITTRAVDQVYAFGQQLQIVPTDDLRGATCRERWRSHGDVPYPVWWARSYKICLPTWYVRRPLAGHLWLSRKGTVLRDPQLRRGATDPGLQNVPMLRSMRPVRAARSKCPVLDIPKLPLLLVAHVHIRHECQSAAQPVRRGHEFIMLMRLFPTAGPYV